MSLGMGTRVFVRLYDGYTQQESEEELVTLPPPLTWNSALSIMMMAVNKQETEPEPNEIQQARLFLLPSDPNGVVAELNARALRMGVRDNDQFAICLHGEEYRRPGEAKADRFEMPAPSLSLPPLVPPPAGASNNTSNLQALALPSGSLGAASAPPSGMFSNDGDFRKRTKRFRSISGKMAAIKSLGDKGIISAEDRGTLKDLLLNNDSQALQDALDRYQSTGEFQQVKDLLQRELRAPSAKRATGDWLPDGFIQDMSLTFRPSDPQSPIGDSSAQYTTLSSNPVSGEADASYPSAYSNEINAPQYASRQTDLSELSWSNSSTHMIGSNPNGMYAAPMEQAIPAQTMGAPSAYNTTSLQGPEESSMMYRHPAQADPHAYAVNPAAYPQVPMYQQHPNQRASFGLPEYAPNSMNAYAPAPMGYPTAIPAAYGGYQYVTPPQAYGYGAMPGQGYYTTYGYGGKDMDDGKWSAQSPMPSYPPACSKEEKKEKIARWLKKREHRNWSNKPSYPVRHAIATKRERGEDGRFVTKPKAGKGKKAGGASNVTSDERQEEVLPMPSALLSM